MTVIVLQCDTWRQVVTASDVVLATRSTEAAVLDAAREAILAVGWRKTTLTDIARRAGVSRMTVYRLWPDTESLLADLMTREWVAMEERVIAQAPVAERPSPELVAHLLSATVRSLRSEPLFQKIVELDPELLLPYMLDRAGRSQEYSLARLAALIERGVAAGSLRAVDPQLATRTLILAAHGFVFSAHTMVRRGVRERDLDAQLDELVERYLTP